jgi:hypothetical protein
LVFPITESDGSIDASGDATAEATEDPGTITCGPDASCSLSNVNIGCCVITNVDSGFPPTNYKYECVDQAQCAKDQGVEAGVGKLISCDEGSDCTNPTDVCCWANTAVPTQTYCFAQDAGNCTNELCDPTTPVPCTNARHVGWKCVPSSGVLPKAPLGYFVCIAP